MIVGWDSDADGQYPPFYINVDEGAKFSLCAEGDISWDKGVTGKLGRRAKSRTIEYAFPGTELEAESIIYLIMEKGVEVRTPLKRIVAIDDRGEEFVLWKATTSQPLPKLAVLSARECAGKTLRTIRVEIGGAPPGVRSLRAGVTSCSPSE